MIPVLASLCIGLPLVYIKVPGEIRAESFREALRRQINLRRICVGFFFAVWHFYFWKDRPDSKAFTYS